MAVVDTIINNAIAVGNQKAALAQGYSELAISSATGRAEVKAGKITSPDVDEPQIYIPQRVSGIDTTVFDSKLTEIINLLSDRYADFLAEYFPLSDATMAAAEAWLQRAITSGGTGINSTVEGRIWQRDRDRIGKQSSSAIASVKADMAAAGFPLPPGALNGAIMQISSEADTQVAAVSRDAAIKAFETEIENVRFAIGKIIDYRAQALAAAGDYIRALAVAPNIASSMSTQSADAQARLISAVSGMLNARTNAAELVQRADMFNVENTLKADIQNVATEVSLIKERVMAVIAAAESVGKQAAAALNGINATSQLIEAAG